MSYTDYIKNLIRERASSYSSYPEMNTVYVGKISDTFASTIRNNNKLTIEKVTFNGPMTIVKWSDGKLTKVRKYDKDKFDPEKAVAMAIVKRLYGDNESSRYMREIKKFTENEKNYFNQPKKNTSKNK